MKHLVQEGDHGEAVEEKDVIKEMKDQIREAKMKVKIQAPHLKEEEDTSLVEEVIIEAMQEAVIESFYAFMH